MRGVSWKCLRTGKRGGNTCFVVEHQATSSLSLFFFSSKLSLTVLPLAAKKTKDDDDDDKEEQFLLPLPEVGGESAKGLFKDRDERHLSIT